MSYAALSAFSTALSAEYVDDLPTAEDLAWKGSPFNWIRQEASGTKGKIGRDHARSILEGLGIAVGLAGTALTANGTDIRVKLSLEWGAGAFKFQQIRDELFEYVFCLGLYPEGAYGWLIPREDLIVDGIWQEREGLTPQHGGIAGPIPTGSTLTRPTHPHGSLCMVETSWLLKPCLPLHSEIGCLG